MMAHISVGNAVSFAFFTMLIFSLWLRRDNSKQAVLKQLLTFLNETHELDNFINSTSWVYLVSLGKFI